MRPVKCISFMAPPINLGGVISYAFIEKYKQITDLIWNLLLF